MNAVVNRFHEVAPRQWWLVIDSSGHRPKTYETKAHAQAVAAADTFDLPTLAPHRVVQVVEQEAKV